MDVVKERLQVEGQVVMKKEYGSSVAALRGIVGEEGVAGLYRAYWIHQTTWAPYNGLFWAFYSSALDALEARSGSGSSPPDESHVGGTLNFILASSVAGAGASVLTSPLDLVKTRMQVQMANPELFAFNGSWGCAKTVLKDEGFIAFFDGVGARIAWLTPRYVIAVSMYETVSRSLCVD